MMISDTAATAVAANEASELAGKDAPLHWHDTLADGTRVLIRRIRKEDAPLEKAFIDRLSPRALEYRFLGQVRIDDTLVKRLTDLNFERDMAFVALRVDGGEKVEIGVSRFYASPDGRSCECTVVVSDEWQGKGLGTLLMKHLIAVARARGIQRMFSIDSAANAEMRQLAASLGFERRVDPDSRHDVVYVLAL